MKLIIVESPNKINLIKSFLGSDYDVVASYGHIRDLSTTGKGGLGVNVEENFKPTYVVSKDKIKIVTNLKKHAKKADEIYLATDPDREGEAISWHIAEVLGLDINTTKKVDFHEITKSGVTRALENPRTIDLNLVTSQETRRIIDRIMGFKLSTLLKSKIGSISAGRVQSVTLKLITDREKEINEFVPKEYWTIQAIFDDKLKASLDTYKNKKVEIANEKEASEIINDIPNEYAISKVIKSKRITDPQVPFRTSLLQQVAYNSCKMSTKVTQSIAQKLFEMGLITYIRTDGTCFSKEFIESGKQFITSKFGESYLAGERRLKSLINKDSSNMAHEAIRPTSLENTPEVVSSKYKLEKQALTLYKLIYNRSLAALMASRIDDVTTLKIKAGDYIFSSTGSVNSFDGYSKVYNIDVETSDTLPSYKANDVVKCTSLTKEQHFTKGPLRFNEARVVKTMEELGIGRPSTYVPTISTLYARDYIKNEKGTLYPTEQGNITVEKLTEFFEPFMETNYTAEMEKELDEISYSDGTRNEILNEFYQKFEKLYEIAKKDMEKEQMKLSGGVCPICGKPLVYRKSKFGQFEACSGYPECQYVKKEEKEPLIFSDKICPKCGSPLVLRKSKKGEFFACSAFPKCHYIEGQEVEIPNSTGLKCPKCGKELVRKKGKRGRPDFYACSGFPTCHYIEAIKE